jgi:hypothetical protein
MKSGRNHDVITLVVIAASPVLSLGFVIPISILIANAFGITLLPEGVSDGLVQALQCLWPVLTQQYGLLKALGRTVEAENYAAFHFFMLLCFLYSVVRCAQSYRNSQTRLPGWREVFLIGLSAFLYVPLIVFGIDQAEPAFRSVYTLYFDGFGVYLLRQYFIFLFFQLGALICLFSFVKLMNGLLLRRPTVDTPVGSGDVERR